MRTLKRCSCGGEAYMWLDAISELWVIQCENEDCEARIMGRKEEAVIEMWNGVRFASS